MKIIKYFLYFLLLTFIFKCGEDNGFKPPAKEAEQLTNEGWDRFEYKGYDNALAKFKEAIAKDKNYAEAYNGAGWASARLTNLSDAVSYFTQCISLSSTHVDAHAGLAFVYNAEKEYQSSVSAAITALSIDSSWLFAHDQTINYQDLHLILAECYFALGNFSDSLAQVQILNPSFTADVGTFEGRSALAEEIERLRGIV